MSVVHHSLANDIVLVALGRFYLTRACQLPALYYKDGNLSRQILKHCSLLVKPYRPTYWAFNAHAQTTLSG